MGPITNEVNRRSTPQPRRFIFYGKESKIQVPFCDHRQIRKRKVRKQTSENDNQNQMQIATAIVIFCTLINLLVWFMYHARQNKPAPPKQEEQHTYHVSIYKASEYKHGQLYVDMTHRAIVKTKHTMN